MTKFMTVVALAMITVSVQAQECKDKSTHSIEVDCTSTDSQALRVAGILHLENSDRHYALTNCSSLKLSDRDTKAKTTIRAGSVTSNSEGASVVAGLALKNTRMQVDFEIPKVSDSSDNLMTSTIIVGKEVIQMKCAAHKMAKKGFSLKRVAGDSASE